jgi:preprotein translocase subunit SecD
MPFTRWIKTPALLVIMAVLLVVSPFSALAEEASSDATQAESASIQEEVTALEASESSVSESSEPGVSVQAEGVVEPEKAESAPVSILSDAPTFYLQIAIEEHSNALGTVPTFEVGLSDASSKQIAKATASPSNYREAPSPHGPTIARGFVHPALAGQVACPARGGADRAKESVGDVEARLPVVRPVAPACLAAGIGGGSLHPGAGSGLALRRG